jgi:hypothetical protein
MAMRTAVKLDGHSQLKARLALVIMGAFHSAAAMRYCLAARRDEKNGFPLTAALEWRKAAELAGPIGPIADRCWIEWERIMHLPRRLAAPIV